VGTGGTITGTGRYLKEVSADRESGPVRIIGADPDGSVYSGGTGRPYFVEGVGEDMWPGSYDPTVPDEIHAVTDAESFEMTRRLAREEGLLVGGSCGMAVVAALRVAKDLPAGDVVVVLLPDGGRGYLGKIFNDSWMADHGFLGGGEGTRVGDVLAAKNGSLPELVHVHPGDAVRDVVALMEQYGVSSVPVLSRKPPVKMGEVLGSVNERSLTGKILSGAAHLTDSIGEHMEARLPLIGSLESIETAGHRLQDTDTLMATHDGSPVGILTRPDVLTYLSK